MTATASLSGGFTRPAEDAAYAFRACLQAMARPGHIVCVAGAEPPAPLSVAAGVALLVLCDGETPVYLAPGHDRSDVRQWLAFHTGAPVVTDPAAAVFALGRWTRLLPLDAYTTGSDENPEGSATLIVERETLRPKGARLTGPGIACAAYLALPEIGPFRRNRALFPRGLDFLFTCGQQLAALPRSTIVEEAG